MKSKKIISLVILATLVTTSLLGGCKAKTDTTSSVEGKEKKAVHLKYYFVGVPSTDAKVVETAINKILTKKINADISLNCIGWADYEKKMQVMIAAQEDFDLAFTAPWMLNYGDNAVKGAFADITTLLPKYAPKTYASIKKEIWDGAKVNGKIYGVVNQQIFARQLGFKFAKDWVDKYKFDYKSVKSYADMEPLAKAVKEGEPKAMTSQLFNKDYLAFTQICMPLSWEDMGGDTLPGLVNATEKTPKVFNQYETPEFKEWVMTMKDYQDKGYTPKDALTKATFDLTKFLGGTGGTYKPGAEQEAKTGWKERDAYVNPIGTPLITTSSAIATLTAVSATSKNQDRAIEYVELINTDKELYNLLCHGIEGTHYKKISENKIENIKDTKYIPGTDWEFGNQFNGFLLASQNDNVWEESKKLNESARISTIFGFVFNSESVKTEIANTSAVTKEYMDAFTVGLFGAKTEAKLTEFNNKLKTAGLDKILAEKQKQVDAFVATKK